MASKRKRSKKSLDMRIARYYKTIFIIGIIILVAGLLADINFLWWIGLMFLLMGAAYKRKVVPVNPKDRKRLMMFIAVLVVLLVIGVAVMFLFESSCPISSFEECAAAGYPVMESYPRKCNACGRTFIEEL